jgi:LAO/AO transport system kinase
VKTIASEGKGLDELMAAIAQHRAYLGEHPEGQQRGRMRAALELETIVREALFSRWLQTTTAAQLEQVIDRVAVRELDPYSAAEHLLA